MMQVHRFDSVTTLLFTGGRAEAKLLAAAIEALPDDGFVVAVAEPRDAETDETRKARVVSACAHAAMQYARFNPPPTPPPVPTPPTPPIAEGGTSTSASVTVGST